MAIDRRKVQSGLGIFLGALLLAISGGSISHAQDAVGNTPPELRDFRLDPPKRESAPEPEAPDPIVAPAPSPTIEPTPAPVDRQPTPTVAEPQRSAPAPATRVTPEAQTAPEAVASPPETAPTPDLLPNDTIMLPQDEPPRLPESKGLGTSEMVAVFGVLLVLAGAVLYIWRKRHARPVIAAPNRQKIKGPVPPASARTLPPRPEPLRPLPIVPAPQATPTPALSITFVPENAVVSFNSLTIRGHFQVTNFGRVVVDDLSLSAILISASDEQQRAIDHFFANAGNHNPTPLPLVKPGGNISLPLKLSVALNAMQTFSLQEKTLLAPIFVAKLDRTSPDGVTKEVARLVCMIGRESTPPRPKMGPLRLDQGPRSFDRLGQRALLS